MTNDSGSNFGRVLKPEAQASKRRKPVAIPSLALQASVTNDQ
jgi:hypothetical protein